MKLYEKITQLLPRSEFTRHVLTMMTGSTISQLIPFLVLPILSRLYSPNDFGVFALYLSIATLLSVICTGRYELAIVLPKDTHAAANLFGLTIVLVTINSAIAAILFYVLGDWFAQILNAPGVEKCFFLIPISVWLMGIYQALSLWANRHKHYKRLAAAAVVQQSGFAVSRVAFGLLAAIRSFGLIVGTIVGQCGSIYFLGRRAAREHREELQSISQHEMLQVFREYRKFPIFNVPYSLLGTFSRDFIVYLLSGFGFVGTAGSFSFARTIISAPITFLSASLGQVFFQHASVSLGSEEFERMVTNLMTRLALLGAPLFVFFMFWAPQIFVILFGAKWLEAGQLSALYAPAAFLFLFTSWPERLYEVTGNQHVSFTIELVFNVIIVGTLWILLAHSTSTITCVLVYSLLTCAYHIVYLVMIFRAAKFHLSSLAVLARRTGFLVSGFVMAFFVLQQLSPSLVVQFLAGAMIIAVYYSYAVWRFLQTR